MKATRVTDGIYRLSANIGSEVLFEGIWPLPHGASMNSYIVKGKQVAIVDGVCDWDGVPETLYAQLDQIDVKVEDIRYVVINHMEPDHTGWLKSFIRLTRNFEVLLTGKGLELANAFYDLDIPYRVVKTGDEIDLGGGKRLQFFETPNVHWPDTMATFEPATGTLMPCDAFGSFGAIGDAPYDDQLTEEQLQFFEEEGLRYYANIVARFSTSVVRAIDKLAGLDIKIIAPGHGVVWRKDPQRIVRLYQRFASYAKGPAKPQVLVLWGSMYGHTERSVNPVIEGLRSGGVEVVVQQVPQTHVSDILAAAWESSGIVVAAPTYEFKLFPPMAMALDELGRKTVVGKLGLQLGSYGWSGGAQRELQEILERNRMNWTLLEPVEFKGAPSAEDAEQIRQRGVELAKKVREVALVS